MHIGIPSCFPTFAAVHSGAEDFNYHISSMPFCQINPEGAKMLKGLFHSSSGCFEYEFELMGEVLLTLSVLGEGSRLILHGVDYVAWARYKRNGELWSVNTSLLGDKERHLHTRQRSIRPFDEKLEDEACDLMLRSFLEWNDSNPIAAKKIQHCLIAEQIKHIKYAIKKLSDDDISSKLTFLKEELMIYEGQLQSLA